MIIKKTTILLLFSIFTLGLINAQVVRKYSNEFLSIGVGARGVGMGNSVIATTTDIYSTYYNPAGLLSMSDKVEVGYMHSEYFAGIAKYFFHGFKVNTLASNLRGAFVLRKQLFKACHFTLCL